MKIAINTRWLIQDKLEGTGWFTHHLLKRIVAKNPEVEFLFFFDRPFSHEFIYGPNVKGIIVPPPARHPFLWFIWNDVGVAAALLKYKPDLYFSTDGFLPLKTKTKTLNTIHDLNFLHYPDLVSKMVGRHYRYFVHKSALKANSLVTVSEFSKQDIVKSYGINPGKINVVYNAVADFKPFSESEITDFKNKHTLGTNYFIFVGALNLRKNLARIFEAYDQLNTPSKLLIVGEKMDWAPSIELAYQNMKNKDQVIFTGRLNGDLLNCAYAGALALVFPSVYEGFGIPILEAMQSGTAVITASNSSMPEVAGNAALLVDHKNTHEISEAMRSIEQNPTLRAKLISAGHQQVRNFNWDDSADKLWQAMLKTIKS